jgi:hypothetical protein
MAKAKAASKKSRGSSVTSTSERMKKVAEEVTGTPIVAEPTPIDLAALRARVVEAHRAGTADELNAAVKALVDAGDKDPPPEARGTLARWGLL